LTKIYNQIAHVHSGDKNMDVNRRLYVCAGKIPTINTISKGGNVIFSHECTIHKAVDN